MMLKSTKDDEVEGPSNNPPELQQESLYTLYLIGGRPSISGPAVYFQKFNFDEEKWTAIPDKMPEARTEFAVATYENAIWIIGGNDSNLHVTNTVFVYNPKAGACERWRREKPINLARYDLCAAILNGKLYVVGGTGQEGVSAQVEVWNGLPSTWEFRKSMNVERSDLSIGVLERRMYAVGGYGKDRSRFVSVEYYCPIHDKWVFVRPLSPENVRYGVGVVGNVLYSVGETHFGCLRRSLSGLHSWSPGPTLPIPIKGFDVVADCTLLYLVGGVPDVLAHPTHWKFNTVNRKWYKLPSPLGCPLYDAKAALISNNTERHCCRL